ncbi:STAS domain-containing protein [Bacillus shivajii]|uniref:STAS domain-containing protein n=1 Tax=Bacillus shivajii TaxID=1983719 RepID=UPI001CFB2DD5|nr:STAS domain-containing protein [Bacillus shivajii]UCZ55153.1 STAS domain-containing protein [Bacillus shivajii]
MSEKVDNQCSPPLRWEKDEGTLKFHGEDAILFWIDNAMKSFIDTIEEVSGNAAAKVVMDTAGFRLGRIVSDFFKGEDPDKVLLSLPDTYATAGWGKLEVVTIDVEKKTASVRMQNSWEFKVNRLQGKDGCGAFIPGHFAGVLTGLFEENIGYEIIHSEVEGAEYDEFHFAPSSISPVQNIHDYARQQEQEEIQKLESMVEQRTKELTNLVKEISSPIIPVLDNIVVIPLLGKFDQSRAEDMMKTTLHELPRFQAYYLILDMTGMDNKVDDFTVSLIQSLTKAASLLGTKSIIVGISPELGIKMTKSDYDLSGIDCFSTLKHAIHFALAEDGKEVTSK